MGRVGPREGQLLVGVPEALQLDEANLKQDLKILSFPKCNEWHICAIKVFIHGQ